MQRMDKKIYSEHWEKETENLKSQGVYEQLSEISPKENTVEVGCGIGVTSGYLAANRKVFAIENNDYLIKKSTANLKGIQNPPQIILADVFELNQETLNLINEFQPKVVTGWFIGSHADDIDKRTDSSLAIYEKPKQYRERIEDIIVGKIGSMPSVEWVHLANRVGFSAEASEDQIIQANIDDYNTHVFSPNGYEIEEVKVLNWNREGSNFLYVNSPNPNYMGGHSCLYFYTSEAKSLTRRLNGTKTVGYVSLRYTL